MKRYKARLAAKGFTQVEGIDFHETFAPIAKLVTVLQFARGCSKEKLANSPTGCE